MDSTEKLSRVCLVACDQAYWKQIPVDGSISLAPHLDSPGKDNYPNTMPASFLRSGIYRIVAVESDRSD